MFFELGTDYADGLGENPAAEADLWIVPRRREAQDQLVNSAVAIGNAIQTIIDDNEGLLNGAQLKHSVDYVI